MKNFESIIILNFDFEISKLGPFPKFRKWYISPYLEKNLKSLDQLFEILIRVWSFLCGISLKYPINYIKHYKLKGESVLLWILLTKCLMLVYFVSCCRISLPCFAHVHIFWKLDNIGKTIISIMIQVSTSEKS